MLLRTTLTLVLVLAATAPTASSQIPAPAPASAEDGSKAAKPEDLKPTKAVDIRKECKALEEVFRRRLALHHLKNAQDVREAVLKTIDPDSAASIKGLVDRDERFAELDYHFLEKIRNCEQRILNRLREDRFHGVADLLEAVAKKEHPVGAAFANLLSTVELNQRWAARKGLAATDDSAKEDARKLVAEAARIQGIAGHSPAELAKAAWKDTKPEDFPAHWLDRSTEVVSFEFGPVPEAKDFPRLDLAAATREDLLTVPEIEDEIAAGILRYRKKNGIQGPEELRFVTEIPRHLVEPLQSVCTVARGAAKPPPKKWTVMVYLNAANNLEPFGVEDMNEMERVGSDANVNIVVECARFRGKAEVRPNPQYLSNPFSEFAGVFYFGLDNSPGTRRYYILKDEDKVRVSSVLLENVGETDAGRPEPLAAFGRWAVENFPAEHYALVIWNHGAGWSGVSSDENTHHGMDMPDVREACEGICAALKARGKEKIDVLDFDACLMATVEVAYELKDTVDYLVASQETEPGKGMEYGSYLRWLATYPEAPPASLAKALVQTYVESYAPDGPQAEKERWNGGETKSALRLAKIGPLKDAIEDVARLLAGKPDLLGEVAERLVRDARRFGRLVDLHDFLAKVSEHLKDDAALKAAVVKVQDLIGYPDDGKDALVNEVVIRRRSAGSVIWGFNDWAPPPRNLAPFLAQSRFAKTPLTGPDEKGDFTARLRFPAMLKNAKSGKMELVKQIDYRFDDDGEKRTVKDFRNSAFTAGFGPEAAVLAEGHNVANSRSHGVSLYFPAYLGFDKDYRRLRFAEGSAWADLCEKFPIKTIEKRAPVALLGLNHVTKAERGGFGGVVVAEELEKKLDLWDGTASWPADLKALGKSADAIKDPRPYGEDWAETLAHYQGGTVILDNTLGGETSSSGGPDLDIMAMLGMGGRRVRVPRIVGPEGRDVLRHLRAGGRVLLTTNGATRAIWDTPLYREALGVEYARTWNRGYGFQVAGSSTIKSDRTFTLEPARKGESLTVFARRDAGVEPFAVLPDGQWIGARVARKDPVSGATVRAVLFGFFLADVKGDDDRRAVLAEALAFLDAATPSVAPAELPIGAAPSPAAEKPASSGGN